VSENNGMGRRLLALSALTVALAVAGPAAADDPVEEKAAVDARIAALQADIAAAKEEEGVLTSQLSAVADELDDSQAAVDSAEASLEGLESELASARDELDRLTRLLDAQTRRLHRLQAEYVKAVRILEQRVRAAYIDEPPDMVAFLVSASSFDDLIDNVEFLTRIGQQDQRIAHQVEAAKIRAAAERRATISTKRLQAATVSVIAARTDEARIARDQLAADRDRLATVRSLKRSALADTRQSRAQYLHEVESLAAQSAALADAIRKAQEGAGSTGTGQPSAAGFIWPCNGPVVSGFGMRWGRMHEGIDIGCAYATPNHAAAAGTVIYAGWMGGYGNLVVVDHGNGLSTAYAHASSIVVGVGQSVAQGETVSLVGSTGNSSGPHLHFEVRVNGAAVDPLLYLEGLCGFGGGARERDRADHVEIGQRAPALVQPEPVACEELVGNGEADEAERELVDEPPVRPIEERHGGEARGVAQAERSAQEVERQPGVDDILDEEDVAAFER
jgi:murein DD-endopeptidase MepM/ murein hydrolase activator NlpD